MKPAMTVILVSLCSLAFHSSGVGARTWYIRSDGTGDAPTVVVTYGSPTFQNCLFYGNYGGVATIVSAYSGAQPHFTNCTFAYNSDGIAVTTDGTAIIEKCIIARCDGFSLGNDDSSLLDISCSNLFGNGSARDDSSTAEYIPSCFVAGSQFCGVPGSHNYYLQSDSPCAPGNHPNGGDCGLIGALPVNCGKVDLKAPTWGTIKSLYQSDGEKQRR